jgi:IclR family pca regulon transcriptional regulator
VTIAAPVHDRAGQVVAAIDVSGQRSHRTPTLMRLELLPPLLAAAAEVSALLRVHA